MTIRDDIHSGEPLISLMTAAALLGHDGKAISQTTMWRRAVNGVKAQDGETVVLETVFIAGKRLTTRSAAMRFIDRLVASPVATPEPKRSAAAERRHRDADRRLREQGL